MKFEVYTAPKKRQRRAERPTSERNSVHMYHTSYKVIAMLCFCHKSNRYYCQIHADNLSVLVFVIMFQAPEALSTEWPTKKAYAIHGEYLRGTRQK